MFKTTCSCHGKTSLVSKFFAHLRLLLTLTSVTVTHAVRNLLLTVTLL